MKEYKRNSDFIENLNKLLFSNQHEKKAFKTPATDCWLWHCKNDLTENYLENCKRKNKLPYAPT